MTKTDPTTGAPLPTYLRFPGSILNASQLAGIWTRPLYDIHMVPYAYELYTTTPWGAGLNLDGNQYPTMEAAVNAAVSYVESVGIQIVNIPAPQ